MPSLSMMYWKALVMKPPSQPLFPYMVEQSTRFWALRDTSLPVFSFTCPSRAPTALKAQHDPHAPCEPRALRRCPAEPRPREGAGAEAPGGELELL